MDIQERKSTQRKRKIEKRAMKKARREKLIQIAKSEQKQETEPEPKPINDNSSYCIIS